MCEEAGIVLAYLPPYSPDLNPIEEAFAQLKAWLKKNRVIVNSFDTFEDFLRQGLEAIQMSSKGHFSKCRIGRTVPRDDDDMNGDIDDQLDEIMIR
jgi:hypothetical protein